MKCTLMHRRVEVAKLELDDETGIIQKIESVMSAEHLPVGVPVKNGIADRHELNKWWADRSIPASRSGVREALETLNLTDTKILLIRCFGLSLSDQYWIRPEGTGLTWEKINFFDNPFSDDMGDVLFGKPKKNEDFDFSSPDNTSDGYLKKRWKIANGKRCLIKGGSNLERQQPFNEVIASKIMDRLGIDHVPYSIIWEDGEPYSVCEDFVTRDTELISAWRIMQTQKKDNSSSVYQHFVNCCKSLGAPDVVPALDRMIVLDYIIANEDRHLNNFGLLRNAETLEWLGFAPIYDSGSSLGYNSFDDPALEEKLVRLAGKLSNTKGKKVYGYLKEDVKALVRSVVDDIGKDERIAELYDLWYERREEVIRTYTETLPPRVPLSENVEFKSVRNAVIRAAMDIVRGTMPDTEQLNEEIHAAEPADKEVEKKYLPNFKTTWQLYFWAKDMLDYENDGYSPHKAAWLLEACAKRGNTVAKYRLGKMYLKGDEIEKDIAVALQWLSQAAEDGNEFAEYLLGKTYLKGEDVERDTIKAETYLRRAADRGNKHAAYTLGKALLDGDVLEQDISEAIRYLKQAADAGFKPAQYVLGKLYYKGEDAEQDLKKALEYLAKAADEYPNAAYLAGKICLTEEEKDIEKALRYFQIAAAGGNNYAEYQLGRLYFFGKDVPRDEETGMAYLKVSAAHGNEYAEKLLESIRENRNYFAVVAAARLFQSVLRLFINWPEDESRSRLDRTDKKLRRKIDEKKQAQGLKQE